MIHKKKKNSEYKSCNTKNLIRYRQLCFYEHPVEGTFSQHFSGCLICLAGTIFKSNTLYFHTKLFKHHLNYCNFWHSLACFNISLPNDPFSCACYTDIIQTNYVSCSLTVYLPHISKTSSRVNRSPNLKVPHIRFAT